MKFCFILTCFCLVPVFIWSDSQPGFGIDFSAGYNLSQHYGTKDQTGDYSVKTIFRHGFTAGLSIPLQVTDKFALNYEFNYVTRGSKEEITISEIDDEPLVKPAKMNVKYYVDYVEFPFLMNYKAINKNDLYISAVGGVAMAVKVKGDYTLDGVIYFPEDEGYSTFELSDKSTLPEINMFDFSLIYGGEIGFNIKSTPLIIAYRFTIGWDYMALPTYPDGGFAPVNLRNQSYSLTLKIPVQIRI